MLLHPKLVRFIFSELHFLFLLYVTMASIASLFLESQISNWTFLYYFFSLSMALYINWKWLPSIRSIISLIKRKTLISLTLIIFFLALLGALIIQRLQWIDYNSVWYDEVYQHIPTVMKVKQPNLVHQASHQQQPPIDYFLANFSLHFYPYTPIGLRIHATIFSSLAILLFFILTLSKTRSWFLAIFGTFLLNFNPHLFFYATEARPQSVAFFTLCFFLFFLLEFLQKNNQRNRHMLILSGCVWSCTIGLQPLIIGFVLLLALIIENLITSSHKKAKNLLSIGLTIFFILSPFIFVIIVDSHKVEQFYTSPFAKIPQIIKTISWQDLINYFSVWGAIQSTKQSIMQILFFPLMIVFLFFLKFIISKYYSIKKTIFSFEISFLFFYFMFPLVFEIIFKSFVHWPLFTKYYILYAVVCLFLFLSATSWNHHSASFVTRAFSIFTIAFFLTKYGPHYLKSYNQEIKAMTQYRLDSKKLANEINNWLNYTLIQPVPLVPTAPVIPPPSEEIRYYQNSKTKQQLQIIDPGFRKTRNKLFKYLLIWKPQFALKNPNIQNRAILFTKYGYHPIEKMLQSPEAKKALQYPGFEKIISGQGFVLIKLTSHYFDKYSESDLANQIIKMLPKELAESTFPLLAYLAENSIEKKEKQKAQLYINRLKSLKRNDDDKYGTFQERDIAWQGVPHYIKFLEQKLKAIP